MLFNIEHLSGWADIVKLPAYQGLEIEDAGAILEEYAKFCSDVIAPLNVPGDLAGSRLENGKVVVPEGFTKAYKEFTEMGWQSLQHPEEFGGQNLPRPIGAATFEMLNAANLSFSLCPLLTDGALEALLTAGSDAQKQLYVPNMVSGKWSGTMNLTEPQAGSDLSAIKSKAVPQADGTYKVSGTKIFITYGDHEMAENIVHLVLARTPDAPAGVKGISLFVVPKYMVNEDGSLGTRNDVECVSLEHKLGIHGSPTAVLEFTDATGYLVGEENFGLSYMFEMMNAARFAVGLQGVGISERSYQKALAFAHERVQSAPVDRSSASGVTIVNHPDVRRMLSRMQVITQGGRALAAYAAGWQELARDATDPQSKAISEFLTPLVKGFCTEMSIDVTSTGVQVHGGMGFIEETGAAQYYRDARILPIYEGTTAIQANDLLGRKTLRDGGATALKMAEMIKETEAQLAAGSATARAVGARLAQARAAYEQVVSYVLETGKENPNAAYGGAVPYLMLSGNLVAGWLLARSLLVAEDAVQRGEDVEFMQGKIAAAHFYAEHVLCETEAQKERVLGGSDSLLAMKL
ncbi:MAG: acyl-CoA dehydrogenase [Rhodobacterales bacterium]|nr:MAG: acyl-CoA dehydrogenase [Rhodobacterales bacterium]